MQVPKYGYAAISSNISIVHICYWKIFSSVRGCVHGRSQMSQQHHVHKHTDTLYKDGGMLNVQMHDSFVRTATRSLHVREKNLIKARRKKIAQGFVRIDLLIKHESIVFRS